MRFARSTAILLALLAGCVTVPVRPPLPLTAHSLFDNYLLVQGFVKGAVINERVARRQLLELVRLEHQARTACVATITDGSDATRERASAALAALAGYAAAIGPDPATAAATLSKAGAR